MNLDDIPLFGMLRSRLGYLNQRQQVVAENIANSDTPDYRPRDLAAFSFKSKLKSQGPRLGVGSPSLDGRPAVVHTLPQGVRTTSSSGAGSWKDHVAPDSETTLDGNQVVLEEQMLKLSESRMNYDAAIGFYQKSLSMLRLATKAPGR